MSLKENIQLKKITFKCFLVSLKQHVSTSASARLPDHCHIFSENDKKAYKVFSTEPEGKSTGGVGTGSGRAALPPSLTPQETSLFWGCRVWDKVVPHGCKAYVKEEEEDAWLSSTALALPEYVCLDLGCMGLQELEQ